MIDRQIVNYVLVKDSYDIFKKGKYAKMQKSLTLELKTVDKFERGEVMF